MCYTQNSSCTPVSIFCYSLHTAGSLPTSLSPAPENVPTRPPYCCSCHHSIPLPCFIFFPDFCHLDLYLIYYCFCSFTCLSSVSPFQNASSTKAGIAVCSLLIPQCLAQGQAHSRSSINICVQSVQHTVYVPYKLQDFPSFPSPSPSQWQNQINSIKLSQELTVCLALFWAMET